MTLDQKDLEAIERLVAKSTDDVAISIFGCLERAESRLFTRLAAIEDRIAGAEQQIHDDVDELRRKLAD